MATTTRAVLRQRISDAMGDWYGTLTCDSGSTTTIVDTELNDVPQGDDDDGLLNWWVICTSGNNIGEVRRISAYVASTNTITVSRAFTNAMDTQTYEVHRHNPTDYHFAMNRAMSEVFPLLYRPVQDDTLIVDNLLLNSSWTTISSGVFTSWTNVGSPTVTRDTTRTFPGGAGGSAKVVASGADGQLTQAPTINIPTRVGKTVTARRWVYATDASAARIRLDFGGAVFENSDYHTGEDQWELLTVSAEIPTSSTQVKMIMEVVDGSTAFFDFGSMVIDPVYRYTLPTSILLGPYQVWMENSESDPNAGFSKLIGRPIAGRRLRLLGKNIFTFTTSETSTAFIGPPQTELLIAQSAFFMNRRLAQRASTQQRQRYLDDMAVWETYSKEVRTHPGIRSMRMGADYESGLLANQWRVEEKDGSRFLILGNSRGSLEGLAFTQLI